MRRKIYYNTEEERLLAIGTKQAEEYLVESAITFEDGTYLIFDTEPVQPNPDETDSEKAARLEIENTALKEELSARESM